MRWDGHQKSEKSLRAALRALQPAKPALTLDQELAEIRARHEKQRAYNRVLNAAKRLAAREKRVIHAISRDVVDQSHG